MTLRYALLPLSWLYGLIVGVRNRCYDKGLFSARSVGVPTVSVGNLSVGGTGKTPLVEYMARVLVKEGKRVAVVTRGYRRSSQGLRIVSDGRRILSAPNESGDEPFQIAENVPGAVVLVDEQRTRGAQHAANQYGAEVILLDDGFQHRALARDFDIVVLNAKERSSPLLPAGRMRESVSGLARADVLVFSHCSGTDEVTRLGDQLRSYTDAPIFCTRFIVQDVREVATGSSVEPEVLKNKSAAAFCGIGNPESFRRTLLELGVQVASFRRFSDHHRYSERDLVLVERDKERTKADWILTTQKDAVRLRGRVTTQVVEKESEKGLGARCRIHYPVIKVQFVYGEEIFLRMLRGVVERKAS
ncbi:MAG: tetraacyldisaccharide 4'-kinase [Bacteroidota bacterium]